MEAITESWKDELSPRAEHWNTEDHLTALASRVSYMDKLGKDLSDAAILTFMNLWHEEKVPDQVEVLAARHKESGARLTEWWRSSVRFEADTALKPVCSWYKSLDLDALATHRRCAPTMTDPVLQERRQQRAYQIAHYAPVSKFIPAPPDVEDDEEIERL
jgi:hypothetical protein